MFDVFSFAPLLLLVNTFFFFFQRIIYNPLYLNA